MIHEKILRLERLLALKLCISSIDYKCIAFKNSLTYNRFYLFPVYMLHLHPPSPRYLHKVGFKKENWAIFSNRPFITVGP